LLYPASLWRGNTITQLLNKHRRTFHSTGVQIFQEAQALRDLAKDEDILVLPANKGKTTVVMDQADYDAKVG